MIVALGLLAAAVVVWAAVRLFLRTPPERLATWLRKSGPLALIGGGGILTLVGRGAIGIPLLGFGLAAMQRSRRAAPMEPVSAGRRSTVRSRFLEMELDHDTGDLEGRVIAGPVAPAVLSELGRDGLLELRRDVAEDPESLRLLEAYLDRRMPDWRRDFQADVGDGLGGAPGARAMTEQQAYEILGLQAGATVPEIRDAHRRLMKRVHPDHGGTDFLAARINEAKAFLIDRHH